MPAVVATPPEPIVSLAQAKRHLRVEHGDDDVYIADLVEVATGWLDGPDGWLGRCLGEQVLETAFPADLDPTLRRYPCPPFLGIVSEIPDVITRTVTVRYRAGYPSTGTGADRKTTVPAPIRHAILLMVGHLYSNREAVSALPAKPEELPFGVSALLSPLRVFG
ncbi:head-tail connector protein [Methylobacterium dankookense]|uniref:Phage gp6-like head-tail connector protein n=1 Tax=Methylobacterium dankookense TaxID=560405 RepID=A0A564G3N6_9HYPH|nr:head-tail connector protein [Methylobacterium dankookense]GJD58144.1 hypothetical protein IFDJLNFL_4059 [Methylobacterium dankookense]VUF15095.1 hypothetical protein MTDSW087_04828 [Methylobacterium dankookense]